MTKKTMQSVVQEMREQSPQLQKKLKLSRPRKDLARALLALRNRAGLTQVQVAVAMGRDQAYISRMESLTGSFPEASSIEAYAEACNSTAGYVFVTDNGPTSVTAVPFGSDGVRDKMLEAVCSSSLVDELRV